MAVASEAEDLRTLAEGGRTNILGFALRLLARAPFLFVAGRLYGAAIVGRYAVAVLAVEFAALVSTLGLKRGLAQAFATTDGPQGHVAWDAVAAAAVASLLAALALVIWPQLMFPNSNVYPLDRLLPLAVVALTVTDVALAALAYRLDVGATVRAKAVVEPWTISIAALALAFVTRRDGLIIAYGLSVGAALIAALVPFVRAYGLPLGWRPRPAHLLALARTNAPLAGADAIEWATRNVDRAVLSLVFTPAVVGVYYMAQQFSSLPQKLKTSFEPVLGPVITHRLAQNDRAGVARQVRQAGFWVVAAQAALALAGSIPAAGVMGLVGPAFVAGAGALALLLWGEVAAATGSVAESALVYLDSRANLVISGVVLAAQIALSFALIAVLPADAPTAWRAASTALALLLALGAGSVAKARLLARLTGAPVAPLRPALLLAMGVAASVGAAATALPEWAELAIGVPLILGSYALVLWRFAFGPDDRALFRLRSA